MTSNSAHSYRDVGVLTVQAIDAPEVVTSDWIDEQLADTYRRTGLKPGTLSELAGIRERRWWPADVTFDDAAARAGRAAIDASGIEAARIGMLVSTSVCKHHLEPSVACAVHDRLGLGPSCLNFDVGNACLGFINGMQIAAAAIDAGHIDYALIVDGEGSRHTQEQTIRRLQRPDATADDVFAEFASLTLGSGAAAAILGRMSEHPDAHRLVGGIARSATQHHQLCVGDLDRMSTDTHALLIAGLDLAEAAWKHAGEHFDWEVGMDWYVVHQVSQVHTRMICERLGIDADRVPLTFPTLGNVGPAAIPITLASVGDEIEPGRSRAVHGHRFGAEHQLHRTRLVTGRQMAASVRRRSNCPPGVSTPEWSSTITSSVARRGHPPLAPARHRRPRRRRGRRPHRPVRSRQPDVGGAVATAAPSLRHTGPRPWAGPGDRRRPAVDGLERTHPATHVRHRVRDLADVVAALGLLDTPLVVAAHDWGGAIAMGWAIGHRHELVGGLAGMVLCNTGIAVPAARSAPGLIRLAASAPMRDAICRRTPVFVEGAFRLSGRRVPAPLRDDAARPVPLASIDAGRSQTSSPTSRSPPDTPARPPLAAVADRLRELDVPVLLAWGGRDPVFDDDFAADLARRLPHTQTAPFRRRRTPRAARSRPGPGGRAVRDPAPHRVTPRRCGRRACLGGGRCRRHARRRAAAVDGDRSSAGRTDGLRRRRRHRAHLGSVVASDASARCGTTPARPAARRPRRGADPAGGRPAGRRVRDLARRWRHGGRRPRSRSARARCGAAQHSTDLRRRATGCARGRGGGPVGAARRARRHHPSAGDTTRRRRRRLRSQRRTSPAAVLFTSGATGPPRASATPTASSAPSATRYERSTGSRLPTASSLRSRRSRCMGRPSGSPRHCRPST